MQCNRAQIADVFGVAPGTIDAMVKEGMPFISRPNTSGAAWSFDSRRCIDWFAKSKAPNHVKDGEKAKVQMRRDLAEVTVAEVKAAAALRSVVTVSDALRLFEEKAAVVKSLIRALPGRAAASVAAESDPSKVIFMLRDEVNAALSGISNANLKAAITDLAKSGEMDEDSLPAPVLVGPKDPTEGVTPPPGGLDYDGY